MEYKVIRDRTPGAQADAFERELNELSKKGWRAVGGITLHTDSKGSVHWAVLMGKEAPKAAKPKKPKKKPEI